MASFMRVSYMLVFHQSKCMCAIKRIFFYYCHVYILEFILVFVFSLLLRCIFKISRVACGSEDLTQHNAFHKTVDE